MGTALDYSCPECGYQAHSMISGYDVGMESHAVGISCATCKELDSGPGWDRRILRFQSPPR